MPLRTLDALRPDNVGGLMCRVLHPGPSDAQLLHDAVQESLDVGFRHLVHRAGAAGRSPADLQAQEEAEQREPQRRANVCHLPERHAEMDRTHVQTQLHVMFVT